MREYQLNNLGAYRRSWLKQYGITPEQYDAMLAAQGGHCAICPATEPGRSLNFFCVDHDHETGKVRGLLCHNCNTALKRHLTPALLRKAANYVERATLI